MKILWLSWKDHQHPLAGGAEVVLREISKRLIREGHEVTVLTTDYDTSSETMTLDGLTTIRVGRNRYLHSFKALVHYIRRLRNKFDLVVEVVNTAPYFSPLFGGKTPVFLFYHQLAREIWFHETTFPLNRLGYHVLEPTASRLLSLTNSQVITESNSSKQDLMRYGFKPEKINIITLGNELEPVASLDTIKKFDQPTMLSLGSLRPMKRTLEQVKAFEVAKKTVPDLRLVIAGDYENPYGRMVVAYCQKSPFAADIECLGRVTFEQKLALMRQAHVIAVTSLKEGWGLIVTEANSQGTPAVVYDVDGLRDSVRHQETGLVTATNPTALADGIKILLADTLHYRTLQQAAWDWSKTITFDQGYKDFKQVVGIA